MSLDEQAFYEAGGPMGMGMGATQSASSSSSSQLIAGPGVVVERRKSKIELAEKQAAVFKSFMSKLQYL